tara:strand:+ start:315 stop:920 length:606 start_codon:yes stop_codon:yes gene_type:complete
MKEKPNYYAIIPAEIRYNKKLTANAKLLYAEITALTNMNGKCNASTKYFSDLYEVSRVSIQNWLKLLEENNYINRTVIYKKGSKEILSRSITLINNPCKNIFTDNTNININNTNITYSNKGRFKKPNKIEIKVYCVERQNNIDAEAFYDFYESKDWLIGNNKMKDWKASVRTWERREKKKPQTMSKIDMQLNEYLKGKEYL